MNKNYENQSEITRMSIELLEKDDILLRKVIRFAQFESEVDLGVNPTSKSQAHTNSLSEQDFNYIDRVCVLVEKRLKDSKWLINAVELTLNKSVNNYQSVRGVKFDDELFKAGRGILETFYNENK